jgi:hypothetical protein
MTFADLYVILGVIALDRLPELARIWAADRKDKRAKAAKG